MHNLTVLKLWLVEVSWFVKQSLNNPMSEGFNPATLVLTENGKKENLAILASSITTIVRMIN